MQTISFSTGFYRALTLCRCAVYLGLGALLTMTALRRGNEVQAVLGYFLLMPLLLHVLLPLVSQRRLHMGIYVLEWLCTFGMVVFCGASTVVCVMAAMVFLASNTALWGWRVLPLMIVSGAVELAVLYSAGIELPGEQDAAVDGIATGTTFAFLLAVCAVAHAQARQLMRRGSALKSEKKILLRYLPKDLSHHIGGSFDARVRREWLTVAFVDLVGFTKATQELPTEALVTLLNDFLGSVNTLVEQWDGTVSKFLGDGVLCVFANDGAATRANAAVQAVRCLTQLPQTLHALNGRWHALGYVQEFSATVGIASGYCCAGDWGSSSRLDYTVIGIPVNLACRLQGEAGGSGGVLLDNVTATLVQQAVVVQPGVNIDVKGMGSLQAFPLMAKPPDITVGCQPLVC